jgi:hypothetical protein
MKVEYSNRALADLRKLSAGSQATFGHRVAAALETRIRAIVAESLISSLPAKAASKITVSATVIRAALVSHTKLYLTKQPRGNHMGTRADIYIGTGDKAE